MIGGCVLELPTTKSRSSLRTACSPEVVCDTRMLDARVGFGRLLPLIFDNLGQANQTPMKAGHRGNYYVTEEESLMKKRV